MKQIFLLIIIAAFLGCSCTQKAPPANGAARPINTLEMPPAIADAGKSAIIDPVCGMVKDSTWTDYTLYKGDTVWFCSAPEKAAFLAKPSRYEAHLVHP